MVVQATSVPLPDFGRRDSLGGSPPPIHEPPLLLGREGARVSGKGRAYRLTVEQVGAVRLLSERIHQTCVELGKPVRGRAKIAKAAGMNSYRLKVLLDARRLADEDLPFVAARPKELRRPRRSTLVRLAAALDLPAAVVDLWCSHCPGAIAKEDPR
jgi:hypothetical protein